LGKSVTYAVQRAIATYLKTSVPSLQGVYDDWPSPSQKLKYPSASLFMGSQKFMNGLPYEISRVAGVNNTLVTTRIVGIYEMRLQLDVWCATKADRHQMFESIFLALNPKKETNGFNLILADYFNLPMHVSLLGFDYVNTEQESERSEWRTKFDLVADTKAAIQSVDYPITTIENNLETPDVIPIP
jgi:hypothetical protein